MRQNVATPEPAFQNLWESANADVIEINAAGRIVDFLDPTITRGDKPEERVRQGYARVLVEEYLYPKDWLAFECPISIGSETKYADIIVYDSTEARTRRDQGRALLIVETKSPTKHEGQGQLVSYIFASSATGGVWTNGLPVSYFRRLDLPHPQLKEWTNIPRRGETWDTVGRYRKTDLQPPKDLKQVFRRCHNAIYKSGMDSEDVAVDMVRLILAKYRDEQNPGDVCEFRCTPEEFETPSGREQVKDRVTKLFAQVVADHEDVFPVSDQITIGQDGLAIVVNELQPFRFLADEETEQVYDVIGTAFEVYVASHLKGARGQYFTNRLVVNLMVQIVDPNERDVILDPACGSGGFLIAALRHVRQGIVNSKRTRAAKTRELQGLSERLFGIDISPKLIRVAKTNMILNGDGHGGLVQGNTLRDLSELPDGFRLKAATVLLTNPPFGASHELRERSREVLRHFELGHIWEPESGAWLRTTDHLNDSEGVPPEILFIERSIRMLQPGGKLAIVIARGVLDNKEALAARQYILRSSRLLAVINCHPNTFAPFNGTKASVLVIERKRSSGFQRNEDYPVFMAISQRVGQDSQGREIFKKDSNHAWLLRDGQRVLDHDLNEISRAWRNFRSGRRLSYDASWTVPLSRIVSSADMRFNPTIQSVLSNAA